ncbi:MAG: hypothetical protein CO029_03620 [Candidatus Magasanikbacteria bacterium CG_4_9_14_0_2_um_filter_41_10]|uniref:Uncharacterized protein n=1 Tax=Candidatus Magasanikbacteria bacterium CG_4_10_14_0_2_um_filter_41_31 TaxID=1974639 RepID=A0A2M7V608_9BACT|nr:MAG: hypothetical protein AUJ37_04700 [Candidatus Magasanikbacteria bacterium CG1_02_41_34]PIZ94023.1 MAG: hypothetical protein COX83_00330 [Candidatus Magasanikbacteria bacterium CG_4_10_14_0_2_um_filter_41_31]PJC53268.1 MAG: hypothetical protein CO029_03620 [Candidatus Magasanikbacteria bacterium CG_4_9_14_0_2_um_filter_41_10]
MFFLVFQRIAFQLVLDMLYFPLWWYSGGLRRIIIGLFHMLQDANASLAPGLWLRHIFTPMYGQTDFQGRLMSFFMRVVNIIGRLFALVVYMCVLFFLFCLWLIVPVAIIFMISHVVLLQ